VAAELRETDVPHAYVALCLRLRRLVPALVAPSPWTRLLARTVANEPTPTAAELVRQAGRLAAALPDAGLAPHRERFLAGQLARSSGGHAAWPASTCRSAQEVRECLGLSRAPGDPDAYRAAHRELAAAAGRPGTVGSGSRLTATATPSRSNGSGPPSARCRTRCATASLLVRPTARRRRVPARRRRPVERAADVRGRPPFVVRVNVAALGASRLPRLVAHEAYPGHHLECSRGGVGRPRRGSSSWGCRCSARRRRSSRGARRVRARDGRRTGLGPWAAGVLADVGVTLDGRLAERLDPVLAVLRRCVSSACPAAARRTTPTSWGVAAAGRTCGAGLLLDAGRARRVVEASRSPAVAGARRRLVGVG
jgi:hypothetical protein